MGALALAMTDILLLLVLCSKTLVSLVGKEVAKDVLKKKRGCEKQNIHRSGARRPMCAKVGEDDSSNSHLIVL